MNQELIERARALLNHVFFSLGSQYSFEVVEGHGGVYMQAHYRDNDIYTRRMEDQTTRKWLLSPFMTDSEIVQTAFKCVLTSVEHRTREAFTYRGKRIFGPHFDVNDLVKLCSDGREDAGGRSALALSKALDETSESKRRDGELWNGPSGPRRWSHERKQWISTDH